MTRSMLELVRERAGENFELHERYMNAQMVKVLKTIGFDRRYVRAKGAYLYDDQGVQYLDLLSGYGVYGVGRNHPAIIGALREVMEAELPALVQMDVSLLAGILAERFLATMPGDLGKVFFSNSGTEAVEAAIKFARYATRRSGLVFCDHAFHGLTNGSLSLNGDDIFRDGFGPLLPDCHRVPFNDLEALERVLEREEIAAFFVGADPGPRREHARRRLPPGGGAPVPKARSAVGRRRDPVRHGPHGPHVGGRALGRSSPTCCSRQRR